MQASSPHLADGIQYGVKKRGKDHTPTPGANAGKFKRAADITRSAAKRYPAELMKSLRDPTATANAIKAIEAANAIDHNHDHPLAATWLGHATVLLRLHNMWVLTDPVFSKRIGINLGPYTVGMERLRDPHLGPHELPPIDLVLVSHAHFDHLDKPSLRKLVRKDTKVVTAQHTKRLIPAGFGEKIELHWDDELDLNGLKIRALRPNHWGARTMWDRHRGFNSYFLQTPDHRVLFAGDTAYTDAFKRVGDDLGGVDLAIFGIGAYDPWIHAHANPEQVWEMAGHANAKYILPMHHSTFKLSNEPLEEPLQRLLKAAGTAAGRVVLHEPGKLWEMPS